MKTITIVAVAACRVLFADLGARADRRSAPKDVTARQLANGAGFQRLAEQRPARSRRTTNGQCSWHQPLGNCVSAS